MMVRSLVRALSAATALVVLAAPHANAAPNPNAATKAKTVAAQRAEQRPPAFSATGTISWSGNGSHLEDGARLLDSERCESDAYLTFNLTATKAASASIQILSGSAQSMRKRADGKPGYSNFTYTYTPGSAIDLGALLGHVTATYVDGDGSGVLTIGEGCLEPSELVPAEAQSALYGYFAWASWLTDAANYYGANSTEFLAAAYSKDFNGDGLVNAWQIDVYGVLPYAVGSTFASPMDPTKITAVSFHNPNGSTIASVSWYLVSDVLFTFTDNTVNPDTLAHREGNPPGAYAYFELVYDGVHYRFDLT